MADHLKFAIRQLLKNPGFAAVAIITLALGIGANSAIFSVVNGVLLKPLPYPEPDRLVRLFENMKEKGADRLPVSVPAYLDWRAQNSVFEGVAALNGRQMNLTGRGDPRPISGARVSANLTGVLGVSPILGRSFTAEEEQSGRHYVVVLSHSFWQREFRGDANTIGQTLKLDGENYTIVGILPKGLRYPDERIELWVPTAFSAEELTFRNNRSWTVVARLKKEVDLAQAASEMSAIVVRLGEQHPESRGSGVTLLRLQDDMVGHARRPLYVLLGAVGLVLLIACTNVANLLLARASAMYKEFAIRAALGAQRRHLFGQIVTESLLLAIIGGGAGLLIASWSVSALVAFGPKNLPRLHDVQLDGFVFGFSLLLSLAAGLLFSLAPAMKAWQVDVNDGLKESGRGNTESRSQNRVRGAFVVAEVALSLMLLIGAGLVLRSFIKLREVDPGFNPHQVLTATILLSEKKFSSEPQAAMFLQRVIDHASTIPGVQSAGAVFGLPLSGMDPGTSVVMEGRPTPNPGEQSGAGYHQVSAGYFRTIGTPFVLGRDFDGRDAADAPHVVIVNEAFVRAYCDEKNAIGQRVKLGSSMGQWLEIVGVVRDVRHRNIAEAAQPEVYVPFSQRCWGYASLVLRTTVEPGTLAGALRKSVAELDPEQPLDDIRSMEALMSTAVAERQFQTTLLGIFALVALKLAAVGIYGVMAYSVSRRTQEIGVRLAFGAQMRDILRLVIGQGMALTTIGLALGMTAALGLSRFLSSLLFEVPPNDLLTFFGVTLLLAAVALLACWIPAKRAARVDPMVALRRT